MEILNLSSRVQIQYLTRSLRSLVSYRFEHSKINFISPRNHVLSSIYQSAHRVCHVTMLNGPRFIDIKSKHLRIFLGNLRESSEIFGKLRKMFGNIRMTTGQHLQNLRKSSENGWKSSENRQKPRYY